MGHLWHISSHQSATCKKHRQTTANRPKSSPNQPQIHQTSTPKRSKIASGGPNIAQEWPRATQERPKDAPRPSKLQPRCLKKVTKMQFAMHFLNVVHQNGVSNGFPKSLLRFLAVRTLTIVWQGQHILHFCDFQFFQQLYPQNHHFSSGF